nr:pentatricopeptide repeat protein AaPPR1074 [Agave angustifolia]
MIHCYASEMGLDRHMAAQIVLLTMYAKCGSLDDARRCFDRIHMDDKDVVAWNAMITAYTSHGQGIKAVATFEEMIQSGVQPDAIIFTSLLSGCSRAGLVDRGMKYFEAMTTIHNPREICTFLENLPVKIKVAGYVPDARFVLHEVSEEEKECNLTTHSGRLAVAFGILKTSPGTVL